MKSEKRKPIPSHGGVAAPTRIGERKGANPMAQPGWEARKEKSEPRKAKRKERKAKHEQVKSERRKVKGAT